MRLRPTEQSFTVSEIPLDNQELSERKKLIEELEEKPILEEVKESEE